ATASAFSIDIDQTKTVDHLKDHIKAKKTNDFQDVDADKLTLWRVTIPDDNLDSVITLNALGDTTQLINPRTRLSKLFPESPDDNTYILVQRPLQAPKRGREPEPETSQKLPKILDATSVSETRIFQTTADKSSPEQSQQVFVLPRDHPNFFDWRTIAGTIFADKSSYIEDLEKGAPNYRYVFLRPRRFGKSAFLNMLCAYYDIHKADIFDDLFGPLYIGKNPTASKNTHLVLKFDLSSISVSGSVDEMKTSFNGYINDVLRQFLKKYSSELGYPEESTTINNFSASQSLRRIL
ncbi:hypothetical protein BGZ47_004168, partial [Haplosporangium gracile]